MRTKARLRLALWADLSQVISQDSGPAGIAERAQPLFDHCASDFRVLLQPFGNVSFEGIEFARANTPGRPLRGRVEIFPDGSPGDLQLALDLADRPVLGPVQPVHIVDLIGGQHRLVFFMRQVN